MKRIFLLILFCIITFHLSAQINSFSVEGIGCGNDTASIALDVDPNSLLIQWYHKYLGSWVAATSFPFIHLNTTKDTLKTIQCGKYRSIVWYNNGLSQEIDSFSISCPLTIGQEQYPILCYADSSGILETPVYGGIPFDPNNSIGLNDTLDGDEYYIYAWHYADDAIGTNSILLGDTIETIIDIPAGWYKAIVTDAIGCSDSIDYYEFKNPQQIRVDTQIVNHNKCIGDTTASIFLTVEGGNKYSINNKYFYYLILDNDTVAFSDSTGYTGNFTSFSASNNMQSSFLDSIAFNNLSAGNYIFSVVDSNACVIQDTIEILEPLPFMSFTSTIFPLICAADTVPFLIDSITGGNPPIGSYFLGFGNDTINVSAGSYDIFTEDALGCTDTLSVTCTSESEIKIEYSIEHILCFGDSSGIITIDSIYGGKTPYSYSWSNGDNDSLNQNVSAGINTVFIIDSLGCTLMQDFTIEQSDSFSTNAVFYLPSCNGLSDGSIKINLTGGVGPLNYYWLNGTGTVDSLYGLISGIYFLVISDANGCIDTISLTLNEPDQIAFTFTNYDNPLLCSEDTTTIDILILGGTAPFGVMWNDGNIDVQRILVAGSYSCIVTDANGCWTSEVLEITEPESVTLNLIYSESSCDEGGVASVSINGGVQPISVLWSTGETTLSIDSLWGTTYWVRVTDSCRNSISDTFELFPYLLETSLYYDSITHIGSIKVDSSSTEGPFSYEWTDVLGKIISTDSVTLNLCEGTYYVTTTDNVSNCSVADTLVASFYLPNGIVNLTTTTVLDNEDLWGASSYTYKWSNNAATQHANICPGLHFVEVTDDNECMVDSVFLIYPIVITLDPAEVNIACNLENLDICITALLSRGEVPVTNIYSYDYLWWNGDTVNPVCSGISPGNCTLIVEDANGCKEEITFVIKSMKSECIPNVFTPDGNDINDTWNLEEAFLFPDSEIRVYSRYGKILFQSVDNQAWDGTNKKGNDVPDGVYFYSIDIGHGFDPINGTVTILRQR